MAGTWLDRERRTARLVRACYEEYLAGGSPTQDQLHALCRLTWITKADGEPTEGTAAVTAPALAVFLKRPITATEPAELARELRGVGAPRTIVEAAFDAVGFVNFYAGFRNTSRDWLAKNRASVWRILRRVAAAQSDDDIEAAYQQVEELPPLPRPRAGDLPAFNLITPVLACLDERRRAPIINSRDAVRRRLRVLGLSGSTLVEQCRGLVGLIGQAGIDDAFALDTADDEALVQAFKRSRRPNRKSSQTARDTASRKALALRSDEDVETLRAVDPVVIRRRHNRMTNALRRLCDRSKLTLEEGSEPTCLFDALVRNYSGTLRDLLIEVKAETGPAFCRMAVGQLLDYRRQLANATATDIAVLLPGKPSSEMMKFFGFVGVPVLWFDADLSRLYGQVALVAKAETILARVRSANRSAVIG